MPLNENEKNCSGKCKLFGALGTELGKLLLAVFHKSEWLHFLKNLTQNALKIQNSKYKNFYTSQKIVLSVVSLVPQYPLNLPVEYLYEKERKKLTHRIELRDPKGTFQCEKSRETVPL